MEGIMIWKIQVNDKFYKTKNINTKYTLINNYASEIKNKLKPYFKQINKEQIMILNI